MKPGQKLLCAILVAFLSFTGRAHAQQTKTPVKMEKVSVERVLDKIEEVSDYVFLYKESEIDKNRIVSVRTSSTRITDILTDIFMGTDVKWTVVDRQIVLSVKKEQPKNAEPSKLRITGTVIDDTGFPVIGAGVLLKGTATGTITDVDGVFTLEVPAGGEVEISSLGYTSIDFIADNENPMTFTLAPDNQLLDEVVVTALGIRRAAKALSYNVQEVDAEKITAVKDANFMNSLSGKIAGVNINASPTVLAEQPGS